MRVRTTLAAAAVAAFAIASPVMANAATSDSVHAKLTGSQVVPAPGDSNGKGSFKATVDGDQFCYTLHATKIAGVTDVSIYAGAAGETGDVVVMLEASENAHGCLTAVPDADDTAATLSESELAAIVADPTQFYVEVHTVRYPNGSIRGQLK